MRAKNQKLVFGYDPMGNRITKAVYKPITAIVPSVTYYTRVARGNTMAVYDNTQAVRQWINCSYNQNDVYNLSQNVYNIFYTSLLVNYIFDPNLTAQESYDYRNSIMLNSSDTCDQLMRTWLMNQIFQIPDTLLYVLNDPNVLQQIKTEIDNRYSSDTYAQILSDLQSMHPSENPAVIEAWTNYVYKLKSSMNTNYYPDLVSQNFGYPFDTIYSHTDSLYWREQHLYGSSRLGMHRPDREIVHADPSYRGLAHSLYTGMRQYELTNHLGNVLSTIKDEKKQIANGAGTLVSYYEPIVLNATDYYPFGMPMPSRQYSLSSGSKYRFGFNTQEKDDEIYGEGNLMSAKYWEYDTRIGRRWNLDPKYNAYESRYAVNGDNPILYNDPNGDYKTKLGAKLANLFKKGEVFKAKERSHAGEWGFKKSGKTTVSKGSNGGYDVKASRPDFGSGGLLQSIDNAIADPIGTSKSLTSDIASPFITYGSAVYNPVRRQITEGISGEHQPLDDAKPYRLNNWKLERITENVEQEVFKATISVSSELISVPIPKAIKDPILKRINSTIVRTIVEEGMGHAVDAVVKDPVINKINETIDNKLK